MVQVKHDQEGDEEREAGVARGQKLTGSRETRVSWMKPHERGDRVHLALRGHAGNGSGSGDREPV